MVGGQRGDVLVITVGIRGCRSMVRDDRRNVTLQRREGPALHMETCVQLSDKRLCYYSRLQRFKKV